MVWQIPGLRLGWGITAGIVVLMQRYRTLVANLILGLCVTLTLWAFSEFAVLQDIEDFGIEWVMRLHQLDAPVAGAVPFAILEFDEEVHTEMGRPPFVRREAIATVLRYALAHGPRLVIVDFDLTHAGEDSSGAGELENVLRNAPGDTQILLVRALRDTAGGVEASPSFLERSVSETDNLYWTNAFFARDDDWQVRRAELVQVTNEGVAIPSVQWLSLKLLGEVGAFPAGATQRIFYSMPWEPPAGMSPPTVRLDAQDVPLYQVRSALGVLRAGSLEEGDWLRGRVVIIGASHAESRDFFPTALDPMPGMMIIANAIHSLRTVGVIERPPLWIILLLEAFAISATSLAFSRFRSFTGMLASGAAIFVAVLPLSYLLLARGLWFNLAIPLLAVQIMHLVLRANESLGLTAIARHIASRKPSD